jgi:predicted nucleotidyltransferase
VRPSAATFSDVIEGFYLQTREGLFFAVKGFEHPPDRRIGVLRYAPDAEKGKRVKDGVSYRRFYHFDDQEQQIRAAYPQYLSYDPVFKATLQSVPAVNVSRIYDPRERFQELTSASAAAPIEQDACAFLSLLQREAQVPASALGITGSILVGLQTEQSDLDVLVFGVESCKKVYTALRRLLDMQTFTELRPLDFKGLEDLYAERVIDTQMDFDEFAMLEMRKVNQGRFRDRTYFVRFVKEPAEAKDAYGAVRYTPLGRATIVAMITHDQDAIYTPCRYPICNVQVLGGQQAFVPSEIISYRGRFCEQASAGELITATGMLEQLETKRGDIRYRLLLGNSSDDTLESSRL